MNNDSLKYLTRINMFCKRIGRTVEKIKQHPTIEDEFFESLAMNIMQIGETAKKLPKDFMEQTKSSIAWKGLSISPLY